MNTVTERQMRRFSAQSDRIRVVEGRAVVIRGAVIDKRGPDQGATEHIHTLARKYMGRDYPLLDGETRVMLRIKPTHVFERGTDGERADRWK